MGAKFPTPRPTPEDLQALGGKPTPGPPPPGPLAKRIRPDKAGVWIDEASVKPPKSPEPAPKKVKQPPPKRLRIFDEFDERGFHPTMMLRLVKQDGAITGLEQQWRHKETDEPEWRSVPCKD